MEYEPPDYSFPRANVLIAIVGLLLVLLLVGAGVWLGRDRWQRGVDAPVTRAAVESYVVAWCRDNVPAELLASADEAAAACRRNHMVWYDRSKELERALRERGDVRAK